MTWKHWIDTDDIGHIWNPNDEEVFKGDFVKAMRELEGFFRMKDDKQDNSVLFWDSFKNLQDKVEKWAEYNFGENRPAYRPLLGAMEELGELCHSFLKMEQNIRIGEDYHDDMKDAIGDVIIFLADFCSVLGFNLSDIIRLVAPNVLSRDWRKNPETGEVE